MNEKLTDIGIQMNEGGKHSKIGKNMLLRIKNISISYLVHYFLSVGSWMAYVTSMNLIFLICKMKIITNTLEYGDTYLRLRVCVHTHTHICIYMHTHIHAYIICVNI